MTILVAIAYPDQDTAQKARATVGRMAAELDIQADEVAFVTRDPDGRYHVHTSYSGFSTAGGAIWGGFWGLLFGALFTIPFAGWAMGVGLGALLGHQRDTSIDQAFQKQVRDHLQPGTSALFMLIPHATPENTIAELEQYGGTVIKTSLSDQDTRKLQDALSAHPPTPKT